MKIISLIGERFGKLIVVAKSERKDKGQNQYWVCKCDCGNYKEITTPHLRRPKHTNSCGCLNKLPKGESCFNIVFNRYKLDAKRRNFNFRLTKIEFHKLTQLSCFYCGEQPAQIAKAPRSNGAFIYNGIDRLDNTKGYIIENCVPCCGVCNGMKSSLSYEQFCQHVKRIYNKMTTVD